MVSVSRHPYDDAQHEYVLKRMQKLRRYSRAIVQNAAANMYAVFTKIADLYSLLDDLYKGDLLYHIVKVCIFKCLSFALFRVQTLLCSGKNCLFFNGCTA